MRSNVTGPRTTFRIRVFLTRGMRVLKLYGQEIKVFKLGRMPAQVLVDRSGMVRFIHYGHDMTDIPSTAESIEMIDVLNAEGRH